LVRQPPHFSAVRSGCWPNKAVALESEAQQGRFVLMGIFRASVCGMGLLAVGLAGCSWFKKEAPGAGKGQSASAAAVKAGPMSYVQDGNGLPTSRIWKSQMAFGDVNGDGYPDLGAVSRLADGPWIFITDGKGNWKDAANGLPRDPYCGGGMDF